MNLPEGEALEAQHRALRRLAGDLLLDSARADDAVQDTWVAALRRPPSRRLEAWLRTVLRRRASQLHRADRRRVEVESHAAASPASRAATAEEAQIALETQRRVVAALEDLAEPYRTVIALRYLRELSPETIAERLQLPLETVRTRLRRGLQQLRGRLAPDSEGGDSTRLAGLAALAGEHAPTLTLAGGLMTTKTWTAAAAALLLGGLWFAIESSEPAEQPSTVLGPASAPSTEVREQLGDAPQARKSSGTAQAVANDRVVASSPCVLSGVVLDPETRPEPGVRVAVFGLLPSGGPTAEPLASTLSSDTGRFELGFDEPFPGILVALDDGAVTRFRPLTLALDIPVGSVELEPLILEQGASVEGLVQLHPRCSTPRSAVRLTVNRRDPAAHARACQSLGICWNGAEFERLHAKGRCDDGGLFAIRGLERVQHRLEVDPYSFSPRADRWMLSASFSDHSRREVTPPASGLLLESEYLFVDFELWDGDRPAPPLKVVLAYENGGASSASGLDGRFGMVVDGDAQLDVGFVHVAYETERRSFVPSELPPGHVERVHLTPATGTGSIEFEPAGDGASLAAFCAVHLTVLGRNLETLELPSTVPRSHSVGEPRDQFFDGKGPDLAIERTGDGGIRLPSVPEGVYDLSIRLQPRRDAPDEAHLLLPWNLRVHVSGPSATVVDWRLRLGCRLSVILGTSADARWSSAYLESPSGGRVHLRKHGSAIVRLEHEDPIEPGSHTLVVRSRGVDLERRPLELRAGEVRELSIDADW